eukprot:TRINITY_DN2049_c3_g1_i1.p1 TRINITY_DN2049_c3_g1~~TRINITY_DN2049_c3_g1_i1.p1  ORF type:complete len:1062 (+),score=187.48 TRINITY_DN2049_c3_g1_i1:71-3256(+)
MPHPLIRVCLSFGCGGQEKLRPQSPECSAGPPPLGSKRVRPSRGGTPREPSASPTPRQRLEDRGTQTPSRSRAHSGSSSSSSSRRGGSGSSDDVPRSEPPRPACPPLAPAAPPPAPGPEQEAVDTDEPPPPADSLSPGVPPRPLSQYSVLAVSALTSECDEQSPRGTPTRHCPRPGSRLSPLRPRSGLSPTTDPALAGTGRPVSVSSMGSLSASLNVYYPSRELRGSPLAAGARFAPAIVPSPGEAAPQPAPRDQPPPGECRPAAGASPFPGEACGDEEISLGGFMALRSSVSSGTTAPRGSMQSAPRGRFSGGAQLQVLPLAPPVLAECTAAAAPGSGTLLQPAPQPAWDGRSPSPPPPPDSPSAPSAPPSPPPGSPPASPPRAAAPPPAPLPPATPPPPAQQSHTAPQPQPPPASERAAAEAEEAASGPRTVAIRKLPVRRVEAPWQGDGRARWLRPVPDRSRVAATLNESAAGAWVLEQAAPGSFRLRDAASDCYLCARVEDHRNAASVWASLLAAPAEGAEWELRIDADGRSRLRCCGADGVGRYLAVLNYSPSDAVGGDDPGAMWVVAHEWENDAALWELADLRSAGEPAGTAEVVEPEAAAEPIAELGAAGESWASEPEEAAAEAAAAEAEAVAATDPEATEPDAAGVDSAAELHAAEPPEAAEQAPTAEAGTSPASETAAPYTNGQPPARAPPVDVDGGPLHVGSPSPCASSTVENTLTLVTEPTPKSCGAGAAASVSPPLLSGRRQPALSVEVPASTPPPHDPQAEARSPAADDAPCPSAQPPPGEGTLFCAASWRQAPLSPGAAGASLDRDAPLGRSVGDVVLLDSQLALGGLTRGDDAVSVVALSACAPPQPASRRRRSALGQPQDTDAAASHIRIRPSTSLVQRPARGERGPAAAGAASTRSGSIRGGSARPPQRRSDSAPGDPRRSPPQRESMRRSSGPLPSPPPRASGRGRLAAAPSPSHSRGSRAPSAPAAQQRPAQRPPSQVQRPAAGGHRTATPARPHAAPPQREPTPPRRPSGGQPPTRSTQGAGARAQQPATQQRQHRPTLSF